MVRARLALRPDIDDVGTIRIEMVASLSFVGLFTLDS